MLEESQRLKSRANNKSSVPITLDRLDWGTEDSMSREFKKTRRQRKELPET
jgi:hypothetical protein